MNFKRDDFQANPLAKAAFGIPGKTQACIAAWFASTNFLQAYGQATASMVKSRTTKPTVPKSSGGSGGGD